VGGAAGVLLVALPTAGRRRRIPPTCPTIADKKPPRPRPDRRLELETTRIRPASAFGWRQVFCIIHPLFYI